MSEFRIKTRVELDDEQARKQLKDLKQLGEKEKIDLKVDLQKINLSKLNEQAKQLQGLFNKAFKFDSKTLSNLKAMETSIKEINKLSKNAQNNLFGGDNKSSQDQSKLISQYKDLYNTKTKLENEFRKGLSSGSNDEVLKDIKKIDSELDNIYSKINNKNKLELFNFKNSNRELVELDRDFEKIQKSIEKIDNTMGKLSINVTNKNEFKEISNDFEKFRNLTKDELRIKVNSGDVKNQLKDIQSVADKLRKEDIEIQVNLDKVDSLKSKFEGLESSIKEAFGDSYVESFRSSIAQLEASAHSLDGSFGKAFTKLNSELKDTTSQMGRLKTETGSMKGFMDDFYGSIAAYSIGDILGDAIVDSIRGIKDMFLELDDAMTNMKKVANESDINSAFKLDGIKNEAIEVSKQVGMSTSEVINGIASSLQAGMGSMEESIQVARSAMILANTGDMSAESASKGLNTIINSFNVDPLKEMQVQVGNTFQKTNQLTDSMDKLNHASNNYAVTTQDLIDGFSNGGSVLANYGVSIGDATAMITSANLSLQDGGRVGNGLKSIAVNLAAMKSNAKDGSMELNKTSRSLKEIAGIEVYSDKSKGEIKDMVTILDEVQGKWKDLNQDQRNALSESIAGKQQAAVFQSLMQNYDTFKEIRDEFSQGLQFGSSERENSQYIDSLAGKLNHLKAVWTSIATTVVNSDFAKNMLDIFITISEAIDSVIKTLDKFGLSTAATMGLIGGLFSGFKGVRSVSKEVDGIARAMDTTSKSATGLGKSMSSAGVFLKSFVKQGLLIAGVTIAVQALASAWEYATSNLSNTANELKNLEQEQLSAIQTNKDKVNTLETVGKEYETLANKAKRTSEEESRMLELGNELAKVLPEIQIGTDSEGNAIISMTTDMQGYIDKTNEAIKAQERLMLGTNIEQSDNALKQLTKGELFGKNKDGFNKQALDEQQAYNKAWSELEQKKIDAMRAARLTEGKERRKHLDEINQINTEQLRLEGEHGGNLAEINSQRMEAMNAFRTESTNSLKVASDMIKDITPEMEEAMISFTNSLDFSEIDSEIELNNMRRVFNELPKMVADGKVNIDDLQSSMKSINEEFSKTGNVDKYNKDMRELAKTLSKETGWDVDTLTQMFTQMDNMFLKSKGTLDSYLESFGSSINKLQSGDQIAKGLQAQFDALNDHINAIANMSDDIEVQKQLVVDIKEDKSVPSQIRDMVASLEKAGVSEDHILTIAAQAMIDFKDGGFDENSLRELQDSIASSLEMSGMEYDESLEVAIDIMAKLGTLDKDSVLKEIEENMGSDKPIEKKVDVKTTGEEKAKEVQKALETLESRPDVNKKVQAVVDGDEDLLLFEQIINNLPVNETFTNQFIVDNAEALSKMKNYQEVLDWINSQPKEFRAKYGLDTDGVEEAKANLDEVSDKQDEINGKESTIKVNGKETQAAVEDINSLIEHSSKLEDGIYKIDFQTNVGDTITQLNGVKDAVNDVSSAFGSIPNVSINIQTSTAAKNLSGLMTRIDQYKAKTSSIKSVTFSSNTAASAKNISGLIRKIQEYKSIASSVKPLTFKSLTSTAAKNITGLINKVNQYNRLRPKTLTFKTNASSVAAQVNGLARAVRNVPSSKSIRINKTVATKTLSSVAKGIQAQTLGIQRSVTDGVSAINDFNSTEIMPRNPIDVQTPITRGYSNPLETYNYGLNHFVELENRLKKIASQLEIIDEKAKNAFGQEKINYLNQQVTLLKQQQKLQSQLSSEMQKQQQALKKSLSSKGIKFDKDGNISNYHTKLVAMNKELERLEELSKKASDASSNYKGDNEKEKDRLSNASKAASDKASKYKENLDDLKKMMDEYLSLTFDDIPGAKEEWEKLNNEIKETSDSIEELNRQQRLFTHVNKVKELEYEYDKLADKIDILDEKMENAYGVDKLKLMDEQIALMKKQQAIQNQLIESYKQQTSIYRGDLGKYGFKFDSNGDFTNLDETLNKFKDHKDLEKVKKLVEEYIKIQRDELPDATKEWEKLESEIKSLYKEQLKITKDIEEKITDVYKKQVEERKKLIDEELDKRLDALDKEKKAYNDARKEADYQRDYDDQLDVIKDLEKKLAIASKDTSLNGQKKVQDLLEKLEEEQRKLQDMVQDKIDDQINDMFDSESERLKDEADKKKEELDNKYSDEKLQQIVKDALKDGIFVDIDGNIKDLEDTLIEFEDKFGDGMTAIGDLIKNEMIANLEIAKDTMKELTSIINELDLNKYSSNLGRMSMSDMSRSMGYSESKSYNNTIQFNSPLMVVEGNITEDILPDVKNMINKTKEEIAKQIVDYIK